MRSSEIRAAGPFQLAIEASSTGALVMNSNGTIVLVNRELERQFGYQREELIGRSLDVLVPELPQAPHTVHAQVLRTPPAGGRLAPATVLFGCHKDGSRIPIEIGLNPIDTPEGRFVLVSVVDITERLRVENAHRAALEAQLEFERVVGELSGRFINLAPDQTDPAIRDALGRICDALDLDRGTLFRIGDEGVLFDGVSWVAPGVESLPFPVSAKEQFPWALDRCLNGEIVVFSTLDEIPSEIDRTGYRAAGVKSALTVPLSVEGRIVGAVEFSAVRVERSWPPEVVHRLNVFATVFGQVLARRQGDESLRRALTEVERLRRDLQVENVTLRREARRSMGPTNIVGTSASIRRVLEQIKQVAATDSTVLLLGETGTGKELFATQIHELGARHSRPMVRVNCAAIPATLIESELFGREKGAYTGALARQVGRFELADHSTIFLDEIGDLPSDVQVKLLRVLEERQIERLGSPRPITVDTRIIAATHRDLEQRMADGTFREDLYYRLNVFPIRVPPLRDRVEDIPLLVWRFVEEFSKALGKRVDGISKESLTALQQYPWPGNIRELRNVVERALISAPGPRLTIAPPQGSASAPRRSSRLVDVEKEHIRSVLERTGWRIRGVGGAADSLGLKPTTLETRMAKLGLQRPTHG